MLHDDRTLTTSPENSALAPFRVRSFRFQWPADLATSWAFEMETIILSWYVLVETGSVLLLTLFASLQYLGILLSPMFGVAGHRIGDKKLLCGMRAVYAVLAVMLTGLAFAGILSPVPVFVIAALSGLVRPSDLVMRYALISNTMPAGRLMGATSVSRTTQDSARVVGALTGAGLVASLGMGPAYAVIACLYATSFALTLGVDGSLSRDSAAPADTVPRASPWRDLKDGIAHIWNTPPLLAALWLALLMNLTAYPLTHGLLPYVAKEIYHTDQTGLGYLSASFAFGALLGSIVLTRIGHAIRPGRMMIVCSTVWYAMILVFSLLQLPLAGNAALILVGFAQSLCMVPLAVLLLRASGEKLRGCVMGIRMLAIYGLPVGLVVAGPLIGRIGYQATVALYCVIGFAFIALIGVRWRKHLWRLDAQANQR